MIYKDLPVSFRFSTADEVFDVEAKMNVWWYEDEGWHHATPVLVIDRMVFTEVEVNGVPLVSWHGINWFTNTYGDFFWEDLEWIARQSLASQLD